MFEGFDHFVVLAKIKVRDRWEYGERRGKATGRQVMASERLDRKAVKEECERNAFELLKRS